MHNASAMELISVPGTKGWITRRAGCSPEGGPGVDQWGAGWRREVRETGRRSRAHVIQVMSVPSAAKRWIMEHPLYWVTKMPLLVLKVVSKPNEAGRHGLVQLNSPWAVAISPASPPDGVGWKSQQGQIGSQSESFQECLTECIERQWDKSCYSAIVLFYVK